MKLECEFLHEKNDYNELYETFFLNVFGFSLEQIFPEISFVAGYILVTYTYELPKIMKNHKE